MRWHEKIIAAHLSVTNEAYHGEAMKSERYFVWQEDGAKDFLAESRHAERVFTGTTDLFTKNEFDPWADEIGEAFDIHGIAWFLSYAGYGDDGYYHYEWVWEVHDGQDGV